MLPYRPPKVNINYAITHKIIIIYKLYKKKDPSV